MEMKKRADAVTERITEVMEWRLLMKMRRKEEGKECCAILYYTNELINFLFR